MSQRIAPPPRPSGHTVAGIGAVESDGPKTPPHGERLDLRGADTAIVLERLGQVEAAVRRRLDQVEGKVDATISDVRALAKGLRDFEEALFVLLALPDQQRRLAASVADMGKSLAAIAQRLGVVERAPREGSHPQLEQLASLAVEDLETEVRRRKAQAAEEEQERALRAANRARAWSLVWKVAAVCGPLVGALIARSCGG